MDKQRFAKAVAALHEYYGKPVSEAVVELYWQGLYQYTNDQLETAVMRHIQNPDNGQWMPKVSDLVKMMAGSTQDAALTAWNKVERAISGVGTHRSVAFDDPIIHVVLEDLGGWIDLGQVPEKELPFVRKRFEDIYRSYKARQEIPPHRPYLIGKSEAQNNNAGFKSDPPKLVGNPEMAKAVLEGGSDKPRISISVAESVVKALEKTYDDGVPF